jgi:hypothetical protein
MAFLLCMITSFSFYTDESAVMISGSGYSLMVFTLWLILDLFHVDMDKVTLEDLLFV